MGRIPGLEKRSNDNKIFIAEKIKLDDISEFVKNIKLMDKEIEVLVNLNRPEITSITSDYIVHDRGQPEGDLRMAYYFFHASKCRHNDMQMMDFCMFRTVLVIKNVEIPYLNLNDDNRKNDVGDTKGIITEMDVSVSLAQNLCRFLAYMGLSTNNPALVDRIFVMNKTQ